METENEPIYWRFEDGTESQAGERGRKSNGANVLIAIIGFLSSVPYWTGDSATRRERRKILRAGVNGLFDSGEIILLNCK